MACLTEQLRRAQIKAKRLAKEVQRIPILEAQLAEAVAAVSAAQQAAADVHTAMGKQDHVHAEEVAAIHAKLDRLLDTWAEVLNRAPLPVAPVARNDR